MFDIPLASAPITSLKPIWFKKKNERDNPQMTNLFLKINIIKKSEGGGNLNQYSISIMRSTRKKLESCWSSRQSVRGEQKHSGRDPIPSDGHHQTRVRTIFIFQGQIFFRGGRTPLFLCHIFKSHADRVLTWFFFDKRTAIVTLIRQLFLIGINFMRQAALFCQKWDGNVITVDRPALDPRT